MSGPLRLVTGLAVLLAAGLAQGERIRSFETEIELHGDDSFTVLEKIRYDFEGEQRRGIYRDIPVRYGRGRAVDYRIALDVESVTDASGADHVYELFREGPHLRIRIGDPDVFRSGVQDYWVRYRVRRGLLWFEDHDEVYWNVTGTEWSVPIDEARSLVRLPPGAGVEELELGCFTGPRGSVRSDCAVVEEGDLVRFRATRSLQPKEGLTIVLGLPKGMLEEPSRARQLFDRVSDYVTAWLLLPLATLLGMVQLWRTRGRDPAASAAIPVRYEPPAGLLPAEVGTVLDESADIQDVTATILNLAVRGHLEIEEIDSQKFLFFSSRDYELRRKQPLSEAARPHEVAIFEALLGTREQVRISTLKNEFYKELPAIQKILYRQLSRQDGYFPFSPRKVRRAWAFAGIAIGGPGAGVLLSAFAAAGPALAVGLCGATLLGFSRFMPRRTRKGRRAYEEILGFQEFVGRVDRDRLERLGGRTREQFEAVLPYAVVLGVADPWADAFADLYTSPPSWYHSNRYSQRFHPRDFVDDVGHSMRTMGDTMTSRPRGSGSSGLGGGGFSSGGFGGGGGGSW
jgi:uncharacterized membrane protein YgcG